MVVPIGVSFSDFLALGSLIKKVLDALSESGGASNGFQALIYSLSSLSAALACVHGYLLDIERSSAAARTTLSVAHLGSQSGSISNGLRFEFARCHEVLQEIFILIQPFARPFSASTANSKLLKAKKQLHWTLVKSDEVQKKLRSLEPHISAVEIYCMALGQSRPLAPDPKRCFEASVLSNKIPRELGYPWTPDIYIEDGLGEICVTNGTSALHLR